MQELGVQANANSLHSSGRRAFAALEQARADLASCIGALRPEEVVFTSGATEANNAALSGIVAALQKRAVLRGEGSYVPHIVVSAIEHEAVLAPAKALEAQGCRISCVSPDSQGFIRPEALKALLCKDTALVSVQTANNEVGTIQPIKELADAAHSVGALFHTDAVQALGRMDLGLEAIGADAASFSAHKVGGPKGVGALYLRRTTPFDPLLRGGGQEMGKRSGTQDVCGAVGFAAAAQAACKGSAAQNHRLTALRDLLYHQLAQTGYARPTLDCAPGSTAHLPHIVHVLADGFESEVLILRLDLKGFEVSAGSACSTHSLEPSHVLRALNIPKKSALCSLRVSLGWATTQEDVEAFKEAFVASCEQGSLG
jgi:cysteine desulfurase